MLHGQSIVAVQICERHVSQTRQSFATSKSRASDLNDEPLVGGDTRSAAFIETENKMHDLTLFLHIICGRITPTFPYR